MRKTWTGAIDRKSKSMNGMLVGYGQKVAGTGPGGLPGCRGEATRPQIRDPREREQLGGRMGSADGTWWVYMPVGHQSGDVSGQTACRAADQRRWVGDHWSLGNMGRQVMTQWRTRDEERKGKKMGLRGVQCQERVACPWHPGRSGERVCCLNPVWVSEVAGFQGVAPARKTP